MHKIKVLYAATAIALVFLVGLIQPARAGNNAHLGGEQSISDQIREEHYQARLQREGRPPKNSSDSQAILPQLGVDPAEGFVLGVQYTNRNLGSQHLLLDAGGYYATKGQQEYDIKVLAPHLFNSDFLGVMQLHYGSDPTREFFGLGNNDVGSDELSTNGTQTTNVLFTLGWRATPNLVLAAGIGLDHVGIRRGKLGDHVPYTQNRFPGLIGLDGGFVNPVSVSLVYNTRQDVTRPTHGYNIVAKIQHVGPELGSDYNFTHYVVDASYLFPLISRRQVIALRLGGQYVTGGTRSLPFFAMPSLGGVDSLRGFYPERFLGHGRILANVEDRIKVADFRFYNMYKRVRIDAVLFGGAGRVFASKRRLKQDYGVSNLSPIPSSTSNAIRLSYGVGTRIALDEALVARIDVGFSDDETGQVYLTFGQMF